MTAATKSCYKSLFLFTWGFLTICLLGKVEATIVCGLFPLVIFGTCSVFLSFCILFHFGTKRWSHNLINNCLSHSSNIQSDMTVTKHLASPGILSSVWEQLVLITIPDLQSCALIKDLFSGDWIILRILTVWVLIQSKLLYWIWLCFVI